MLDFSARQRGAQPLCVQNINMYALTRNPDLGRHVVSGLFNTEPLQEFIEISFGLLEEGIL